MSLSNEQIFDRLQELGWNPPPINESNRMYGMALIYNDELDKVDTVDNEQIDIDELEKEVNRCNIEHREYPIHAV